MSEPQSSIFCPNCGRNVTERDRFCPECGARLPERKASPEPSAAASPTVVIPPDQPPAAPPTVVIPPDQPPAAPPTVVIPPDQPPAAPPTVVIPPDQPPAAPPTVVIPPAPPPRAAAPPAPPAAIPPVQPIGSPPDPFAPPASGIPGAASTPFQIPTASENISTSPSNNRLVWFLVGGIGCLLLIFIAACAFIVVSLYTFSVTDTTDQPPAAATVPSGSTGSGSGGGLVAPITDSGGGSAGTTGSVLFRDDFTNPAASQLGTSEDADSRYAYEQNQYVIEVKRPEMLVWALVAGQYRDVIIEASYTIPRNSPPGAAGLIFHYQDSDNFYLFSVSNDGYYALELLKDNQWKTLIDWTQHPAIDPVNNRMRVELNGDRIKLYVNDRELDQTRDPTFTSGEVGLAVTSFDEGGSVARYNEIVIRQR